jgi:hypothetical protein
MQQSHSNVVVLVIAVGSSVGGGIVLHQHAKKNIV